MIVQPILLKNKVFQDYIFHYTTKKVRDRWDDNSILSLTVGDGTISAKVKGSQTYSVEIKFTDTKIKHAVCTCPFDQGPACKHIVHALINADEVIDEESKIEPIVQPVSALKKLDQNTFILEQFSWDKLDLPYLFRNSELLQPSYLSNIRYVEVDSIDINLGKFNCQNRYPAVLTKVEKMDDETIHVTCACSEKKTKLCSHMVLTLWAIKEIQEYRLFFEPELNNKMISRELKIRNLEDTPENRNLFYWNFDAYNKLGFIPKKKGLILFDEETKQSVQFQLIPVQYPTFQIKKNESMDFLVFSNQSRNSSLLIEWFHSLKSKQDKPKNPFGIRDVSSLMLRAKTLDEARFYGAVTQFENSFYEIDFKLRLDALIEIAKNPLQIPFYRLDTSVSERVMPKSIKEFRMENVPIELELQVDIKEGLFAISLQVSILGKMLDINHLNLVYDFFLVEKGIYYLVSDHSQIKLLNYFKKKHWILYVTKEQFDDFQQEVLIHLDKKIKINYSFVKPAPKTKVANLAFDSTSRIYISETDDFIQITPVIAYGEREIQLLSNEVSFYKHPSGDYVKIPRDEKLETVLLHAFYEGMQDQGEELFSSVYINKNTLFDPEWFLTAFEKWNSADWEILGFDKIKKWKFSPQRANVQVSIKSGINWFDTEIKILFGNQELNLKELQKAVRNRSRFVTLGNGQQGILPQEWLDKFERYFRYGELVHDVIRTSKLHFSLVEQLYDNETIDSTLKSELSTLKEKFAQFSQPKKTKIPQKLQAQLRPYQEVGFNWLCALDELQVGGCLADDMGLGKTIQIISFFLHLKQQNRKGHLVVVPTSLIFNWQNEMQKFAPSLKLHTHYGPNRQKDKSLFEDADVILTTYGMVNSDIQFLMNFEFEYIVLDESQAIKNPSSQRFKSVRLLAGKNHLVMTGTPVENNTMDLYAQMTFANPGLLGTWKQFKDIYATPIDQFNDIQRAEELQKRVQPFILRRTKKQVATDLPEKTEMMVYCEMGDEQMKVYEAYRQEMVEFLNASTESRKNLDMMHMLAGMTKIRQICNSPALLADEENYGMESAKINVLLEELQSIQQEHKVVVFSQFVGMLELIEKELKQINLGYVKLTGQTRNRKEVVEKFQQDESVRVFLISLKAGGTGLNLTEADYVFLVDPWWNPAVENQAIDRVYRIGQTQKVIAVRLITPGTIEEKMLELQKRKRELAGELIQTDDEAVSKLTLEDFAFLLS